MILCLREQFLPRNACALGHMSKLRAKSGKLHLSTPSSSTRASRHGRRVDTTVHAQVRRSSVRVSADTSRMSVAAAVCQRKANPIRPAAMTAAQAGSFHFTWARKTATASARVADEVMPWVNTGS